MLRKYSVVGERIVPAGDGSSPILYFSNPDDVEKDTIIREYGINDHNYQSALDPNEISRLEFEDKYVSFIFKKPQSYINMDKLFFKASTVGVFYFDDKIIIVSGESMSLFEDRTVSGIDTLFDVILQLLSQSINHFIEHLKVISMITDELEDKINKSMENKNLLHLFSISKSLVYYLNAIEANTTLINKIKRSGTRLELNEKQMDLIENIFIDNNQCYRQAEIYSSILSGLMDARGTIINNNMNVLFKQLTIINVIFLPLNLIASIGGMSEFSMMTGGISWKISYTAFFLSMVVIGYRTYLIVKRLEMSKERSRINLLNLQALRKNRKK